MFGPTPYTALYNQPQRKTKMNEIDAMIQNTNALRDSDQELSVSYKNTLGAYVKVSNDNHISVKMHRVPEDTFRALASAAEQIGFVSHFDAKNTNTKADFSTATLYISGVTLTFFGPSLKDAPTISEDQLSLLSD